MGAALDVEKQAERQQQPNSWQPHQASEMLVEPPPQEEEKPESFESSTPTPEQGQLQQRQPSTPDLAHRDPPADSAYGYVIAVCVLGQNAVTWGMATSALSLQLLRWTLSALCRTHGRLPAARHAKTRSCC